MQARIPRPPERHPGTSSGAERCAIPDNERRTGPESGERLQGRYKRLLWFALIYLMSLAAFAALVYGLKLIIPR